MADKQLKSINFGDDTNWIPLPIVTASDNDKILMVENGEWVAVEVANAEDGAY